MAPRDLVYDADFVNRFCVGKDEDAVVSVTGQREHITIDLPYTTAEVRRIVVAEAVGIPRTVRARTANYGADALRVLPDCALAAGARVTFVFDRGYWKVDEPPHQSP